MTTTTTTPAAAPIPWHMRADLVVAKLSFSRRTAFNIKDPVSSRFFQLREEEFFILKSLNGKITLSELQQAFAQRFAPSELGTRQLQSLLMSLERQSLIVGDVPRQAERILRRSNQIARAKGWNLLMGFLAIRFRGIDPQRFLAAQYRRISWLFDNRTLAAALVLMVSAVTLVLVQWETLRDRLPGFTAFFKADNLLWLAVAVGVVKILHEFGHAMTCHHFGGECREMGLMLLVFTPCLYCDVSDAWLMRNKWHRIAISAAGILVELTLAAACTFLWWFTEPGALNSLFLNVMIVSSVNTVLFNGNPLLRFDGYFVLADLVEIPNLRQTAGLALQTKLTAMCLGTGATAGRMIPPREGFLIGYAVAATVYRVIVVCSILWMLHTVFGSYGLLPVAQIMSGLLLTVMAFSVLRQGKVMVARLQQDPTVRKSRVVLTSITVAALIASAFLIPLPHRIIAPCLAELRDAKAVFVTKAGRLPSSPNASSTTVFSSGSRVNAGDVLVELQNSDLQRRVLATSGRIAALESRLKSLKLRRTGEPALAAQLPTTEQTITDVRQQLIELQEQQRRLKLIAPVTGIILPPEQNSTATADDIETTTVNVLDARRAGDTLVSGTTFCRIGDPTKIDVVLYVDQADVNLVQPGQDAFCWFAATSAGSITGTVQQISEAASHAIPPNLTAAGSVPMIDSADGPSRPASVLFQVRVQLDSTAITIPIDSTGWATVRTQPLTLARRVGRFLSGTLRFSADFSPAHVGR